MREAFVEEADAIIEHAELDLTEPTRLRPAEDKRDAGAKDVDGTEPEPVRLRHRFDSSQKQSARRLIVLRDDRRGRPTGGSPRHGSDPPG